ncbi:hypothetical protein RHSIM_Rhsim10G0101100 [Rhododendron simsii]|uniref:N-acetyltransferase domain-containing protein n=1 Tax=Rhododendron simsii TaxID=118357 RepID=A0A834GA31_RHOSS|nr:hypothetical protein RHSIM_Rhsim10G0101100 [Rhododendron simsii]
MVEGCETTAVLVVREFDGKKDCKGVEEVERRCEVGSGGKLSLFTDLLGDPICRVRHSPAYLMLVAEAVKVIEGGDKEEREIVGMIRGCIKSVTCGKKRMGIGLELVRRIEEWFRENGAEYSYIATENDNKPSVNLFTVKCGYSKFRTPSILVQPVFAHRVRVSARIAILKLAPSEAESLYRRRFSTTEFFPRDIDSVLNNKLNLGTFIAFPKGTCFPGSWPGTDRFLSDPPNSWAVLSVWNSKDVFTLEVRGASRVRKGLARTTRLVDRAFPWLHVPSVPEVFRPFGLHFLYGLGGDGPMAVKYMKALCGFAHNLAMESGCGVVATEVSSHDPLKSGVPHWKALSCPEDLWCIKRLGEDYSDGYVGDWTKSPPGVSVFVDPREF